MSIPIVATMQERGFTIPLESIALRETFRDFSRLLFTDVQRHAVICLAWPVAGPGWWMP
jgi:hypothetical protein